jgi:hypothetical protein
VVKLTWRGNLAGALLAVLLVTCLFLLLVQPRWAVDLSSTPAGGLAFAFGAPLLSLVLWAIIQIDKR